MTSIPRLLWAQDKKHLHITVDIRDIITNNSAFSSETLTINVDSDTTNFNTDFQLSSEIIPDECTMLLNNRGLKIKIVKKLVPLFLWVYPNNSLLYFWIKISIHKGFVLTARA